MISAITFTHGAKTCASEPGMFCMWLSAKHLGTMPMCIIFDAELKADDTGWLQRCPQCIEEFGEKE